jgi:predicted phosphoribosyltransferase
MACVAADAVDVTTESAGAVAGAAGVAAGALDADPGSVTVETAVWAVEVACPAAAETLPATEEVFVATPLAGPSWAVAALGLVAADADRAVRREKATAALTAASAMPAAHRQYRRILVTSPLVTTGNLIRSGLFV